MSMTQHAAVIAARDVIAAAVPSSVPVFDGPPVGTETRIATIAVAHRDDTDTAITAIQQPAALGRRRRQDVFQFPVQISTYNSAGDIAAARARAYEIGAIVEDALVRNITLGGAVQETQVVDSELFQGRTGTAVSVALVLLLQCEARTSPYLT